MKEYKEITIDPKILDIDKWLSEEDLIKILFISDKEKNK